MRYETEPKRTYADGPTKSRTNAMDWNSEPDWAVMNIGQVLHVTKLSKSALDERIQNGTFPKPGKDGKRRVWSVGVVREWCEKVVEMRA